MISIAEVRRLRERPLTPNRPVLSVYLDVDQSRAVNLNREFATALKTRLRDIEHRLEGSECELFRLVAARVQEVVARYQPRAKTLVLFADAAGELFWEGELRVTVPTEVRWAPGPYLRPLVEALDAHQRYAVVLLGKERARVLTVCLGEIEEERETIAPAEVRHKNASGTDHQRSQMNFQRQDDMHVQWHVRHAVELLEEVARTHPSARIVIAGPVEATSELARSLPRPLADQVVGTLRIAVESAADQVLQHTTEVIERAKRETEKALVAALFERGVFGLTATFLALQEGRTMSLAYADGFAARGYECPRCRALFDDAAGPTCGYCGEPLMAVEDVIERALTKGGDVGARVEKIHDEAATRLRAKGGIGALLRF